MSVKEKEMKLILRRLADDMSAEESQRFEELLSRSSEFRQEYERRRDILNLVTSAKPYPGETYYSNLTPRVREKLEEPDRLRSYVKYAFSAAVILIFFTAGIIIINLQSANSGLDNNFALTSGSEDISEFLEYSGGITALWEYFETAAEASENTIEEALAEIETGEIFDDESIPVFDSYSLVKDINDNEFEEIYKELQNAEFGF